MPPEPQPPAPPSTVTRGRLKVFFGMAPGVGKTYAMLEEARARAAQGTSVLVGYAEPHVRPDTEALLLGLEILPYKLIPHRTLTLKEFDLDAALARKPSLLLVDELAHTNPPSLRHPKRWQDVIELLSAGIDVYTTLNVQHLESANDIVERITGVRVRETLPDHVLEQADEVELIDIAPDELLDRLRQGKILRPDRIDRATTHFFTRNNLIALRELALRTTAQRVDAQMLEARRQAGVRAPWPAAERLLVCVGPSPMSRRLVRSARRLATGLRAPWAAAYVETPAAANLPPRDRLRVEATLKLAEDLGATTATLAGPTVADELLAYAQTHNVTKIVIGKPARPRWKDLLFGSVVDDLVRRSADIDIYVIRGDPAPAEDTTTTERAAQRPRADYPGYALAVATVAAATAIGYPLYHHLGLANANVLMLYLLGVLWVATRRSRGAAVLASLLGVAAFDVCFVPPYFTLTVSDRQYLVTFAIMLLTALVISTLTHRVRAQAESARHRERRTAALLALSKGLAAARTVDDILTTTVRQVATLLDHRAVILLPDPTDQKLHPKSDTAHPSTLSNEELTAATWAHEHSQPAGHHTDTLPTATGTYLPLTTPRGTLGVLAILPRTTNTSATDRNEDAYPAPVRNSAFENRHSNTQSSALSTQPSPWPPDHRQLLQAIAAQSAIALERATLAEETRQAWERVEAEFLRNTLLSAVSHDLRTPLAAIAGAASTLIQTGNQLPDPARADLLNLISAESERMDRLIHNLLDMTRLESCGLTLKKERQPLQEVIGATLTHLDRCLTNHPVHTHIPPDLPEVDIDPVAIEQVLTNLLDNAVQYTPPNTPIDLTATTQNGTVTVEVSDQGPGLPPGTERRVFDKFFRIPQGDSPHRGLGLGLAICRGIIQAHHGTISAQNRPQGGTTFHFTLPTPAPPTPPPPS